MRKAQPYKHLHRLTDQSGDIGRKREFPELSNRKVTAAKPEKENAAPAGPRNGARYSDGSRQTQKYRTLPVLTSVRLAPIWSDGYFCGWEPIGYAAARVLSRLGESRS